MYRRIVFIGFLPLLGSGALRASLGTFLAIVATSVCRELSPFVHSSTNVLLMVAQYQILATFLLALILISDSLAVFGLEDLSMSVILLALNFALLIVVVKDRHVQQFLFRV
jgi:hypothetical protein